MPIDPSAYVRLFENNADGVAVLEDLVSRFSRPQVSRGGIDAILMTYERGGARKVIDYILAQINNAHGVPDDAQAQTLDDPS